MTLDVVVEDAGWHALVPELDRLVADAARLVLPPDKAGHSVNLLFADDATLHQLNRDFRHQDKPTNVLSFPGGPMPDGERPHLGDIAFARETITREAALQGKTPAAHTSHLIIHGLLHLLGFDHETEAEADIMEAREIALLAQLGYANPYQS